MGEFLRIYFEINLNNEPRISFLANGGVLLRYGGAMKKIICDHLHRNGCTLNATGSKWPD